MGFFCKCFPGTLGSIEPDMLKEPNSSLTNSSLFSSRPQSTTVDLSFKVRRLAHLFLSSLIFVLQSSESMSDLTDLNFVGLDAQKEPNAVRAMLSPPEGGWLITGSTDCKLRFWDLKNASESYTFSGLGKQHKAT
jgi:WD40 repeat protein